MVASPAVLGATAMVERPACSASPFGSTARAQVWPPSLDRNRSRPISPYGETTCCSAASHWLHFAWPQGPRPR
jgi:hypothetical protein